MFQFIRELNMIYADEKPGIESIGGRLNLNDFPVYKSFEFIDNSKELKGFIQNNSIKLKTNRKKGHGVLRNRNGSDGFRSSDDSSNGTRYAMSSSSESEGSKGRKKVYLKRDLQDYDSPEMVAFLDDSSYDLFKDILTDKESLCQDEVLTENYELGHYNFSSILNSDSESSDSTKETLERLSCIANELKFIAEDDCKNERHNSKRFLTEEEEKEEDDDDDFNERDDVLIDHHAKTIVHAIHLSEEVKDDDCKNEQHGYRRLIMEDEEDLEGRPVISIDNSVEKIARAIQLIKGVQREGEGALSKPLLSSITAAECSCPTSDAGIQSETSMQGAAEICEQVLETESMSSGPESLRISSDGESLGSSNDADRPSGRIEHSGGSISLPSSNSTASAHSFAFPILATEWPASPVRIKGTGEIRWPASTDPRRQLHRPRRWKALLCCKFVK
ncbi:hypothetical protein P3X46_031217 [Hevea brasiliensis]|uniref:Uncharacterized protein n=1 Tax=Hevea brasiliensis TaxID=3981 RepID=A0ABQ9KL54_HEVBR|nr:uncharacterized protein LOC110641157 [Hevea brasiliensis]KAJ9140585.1 hypothetical protein P3X46_031217 [Hevea brasiliensis]